MVLHEIYTNIYCKIVEYDKCFGFIFVYFVSFRHVYNENKSWYFVHEIEN
jgi:hypothetical protein